MSAAEVRACTDRIAPAVREAASTLDFTGGSSVGEVADCASDQLGEYTCYLTPAEFSEVYAAVTRQVLLVFGYDLASSDSAPISADELADVADGRVVRDRVRR